jgi:signal transduction histidine kinase
MRVREIDLGELVRSACRALIAQAEAADVGLRIDVGPTPRLATIDADKIAWAVVTLVGNALRYVRRPTRLMPGGSVEVGVAATDREVALRVSDDGPGIAEAQRSRLFDATDSHHAAGLSLLLVRDVVEAHGGSVEIQSRTDAEHGTTITIRLPRHATSST